MVCENCDPKLNRPGRVMNVTGTSDLSPVCSDCGDELKLLNILDQETDSIPFFSLVVSKSEKRWDKYFHTVCVVIATKSPCLSRHIGALLVRDNSIVATGYNGPPRRVPHCGHERFMKDSNLATRRGEWARPEVVAKTCPRRLMGFESGTHMELCPAQHAEQNCISNAARLGVEVRGTTLYMNSVIPCKNCFGTLINAGIVEVVVDKSEVYDKYTQYLIDNSSIVIREFEI